MPFPPFEPDPSGDVERTPIITNTGGGGGPGSAWHDGAGAPGAGLGADGDYYLNTSNGDVYLKSGGSWGVVGNIEGPAGPAGAAGAAGATGVFGGDSLGYVFDSTTTDSDPGSGKLRLNNATLASATFLYIDDLDENGTDQQTWINALDDSSNTSKGRIRIVKQTDQTAFAIYAVTGSNVDPGGYTKIVLNHIGSHGSFTNGDKVFVTFCQTGNVGAQGVAGSSGPIWVPAAAMTPSTTNGATPGTTENATNKEMVDYLSFDPATSQSAWFPVRFPAQWGAGTVTFQYLWKQSSTGTNGVTWGAAGVSVADNETIDVAPGTEVTTDDTALGSATKLHISAVSSAITIAGTPAVGELVWFKVRRAVENANDTLNEAALLVGVVVTYT